jgi:WD40 repeat protein
VKSFKLGHYVSGGEDRTLKIWTESLSSQDIALPCSIWSLALDQNGDIFVAGSDGFMRSFTTDAARFADQDVE